MEITVKTAKGNAELKNGNKYLLVMLHRAGLGYNHNITCCNKYKICAIHLFTLLVIHLFIHSFYRCLLKNSHMTGSILGAGMPSLVEMTAYWYYRITYELCFQKNIDILQEQKMLFDSTYGGTQNSPIHKIRKYTGRCQGPRSEGRWEGQMGTQCLMETEFQFKQVINDAAR